MRFERNLIVEFASVHATEESATTSGGGGGRRRKKEKVATHDKDGKRARYFADDDRHDLKALFEREKLSTAEDQVRRDARNFVLLLRFKSKQTGF